MRVKLALLVVAAMLAAMMVFSSTAWASESEQTIFQCVGCGGLVGHHHHHHHNNGFVIFVG